LSKELNDLLTVQKTLDGKSKRTPRLIFSALTALLLGEISLGYYIIYEIAWAGWDMVEPVTYTVGQLYFLCSIYFYSKTKRE